MRTGRDISRNAGSDLTIAVFGERDYPAIMGRIAMPSLIMQAASPSLGAVIEQLGTNGALAAVFAVSILNFLFVVVLFILLRQRQLSG